MSVRKTITAGLAGLMAFNLLMPLAVSAAPADNGLSLQVSPSPLVLTIKPGESRMTEIKIFNAGTAVENLKIGLESIKVDNATSQATLDPNKPVEIRSWITFSDPKFSVKSGERFTERVQIDVPPTAGFSYNFAMVINRQAPPNNDGGQTRIVGSLAIFTLIDIDRPGAVRKLTIDSLKTNHHIYEYLPAEFTLHLHNTGNTLLLPGGNAYVQRKEVSDNPLSVLNINPNGLYLLPGVQRDYKFTWSDGFPRYVTTRDANNAAPRQHLEWNWRNSHFRIGRYVARVVSVYDDGHRDVPVEAVVSFWVIPWKLLLGGLLGLATLLFGLGAMIWIIVRTLRRKRTKHRE